MEINNKKRIFNYLNELYPDAGCELTYTSDYSFLIAVMLSAQTTDKKVNKVTDVLFLRYKSLEDLSNASLKDLEEIIMPLGLYKVKAKNVKQISIDLLNRFDGKVPSTKKELMSLPGVGNKTANVVRIELFKEPEFPVDTHVARICKRLKFVIKSATVEEIENIMRKELNEDEYIKCHHQLIHFGRYFCKATKPNCNDCKISNLCCYEEK